MGFNRFMVLKQYAQMYFIDVLYSVTVGALQYRLERGGEGGLKQQGEGGRKEGREELQLGGTRSIKKKKKNIVD